MRNAAGGRRADDPGFLAGGGDAGGLGVEGPRDLRDVRRFSHEAMATSFEVYAAYPDARYAAQAAQAAFDVVDRLERELSRFVPNSDVSRINRLSAGERTRVSPTTLECLLIARHVHDMTSGAFDASIGTGLASLELDSDGCEVHSTKEDVQIDLGGIGKGYAVDLVAELLEEWGLERALVHGGFSSVLALDAPLRRDGWPLTLSDPSEPSKVLVRLSARQAALGASGLRKGDHIVDPRSGERVLHRMAAWVLLPQPQVARREGPAAGNGPRAAAAAVADALTTAFMVMRAEDVEALCAHNPGLEAWILDESVGGPREATQLRHFGGSSP